MNVRWVVGAGVLAVGALVCPLVRADETRSAHVLGRGALADRIADELRASSGRVVTQWPHTMTAYRQRTQVPDMEAFAIGRRPVPVC